MPRNSPPTSLQLRGLRVLVVEDEMMLSMLLEELLGAQGCEIVGPVARLPKAIDLASTEKIDAGLLDLNIDGKEVYPAAEILAARGIPFAFVSGYGLDRLDKLYRDRPVLQKPFHFADLARENREAGAEPSSAMTDIHCAVGCPTPECGSSH